MSNPSERIPSLGLGGFNVQVNDLRRRLNDRAAANRTREAEKQQRSDPNRVVEVLALDPKTGVATVRLADGSIRQTSEPNLVRAGLLRPSPNSQRRRFQFPKTRPDPLGKTAPNFGLLPGPPNRTGLYVFYLRGEGTDLVVYANQVGTSQYREVYRRGGWKSWSKTDDASWAYPITVIWSTPLDLQPIRASENTEPPDDPEYYYPGLPYPKNLATALNYGPIWPWDIFPSWSIPSFSDYHPLDGIKLWAHAELYNQYDAGYSTLGNYRNPELPSLADAYWLRYIDILVRHAPGSGVRIDVVDLGRADFFGAAVQIGPGLEPGASIASGALTAGMMPGVRLVNPAYNVRNLSFTYFDLAYRNRRVITEEDYFSNEITEIQVPLTPDGSRYYVDFPIVRAIGSGTWPGFARDLVIEWTPSQAAGLSAEQVNQITDKLVAIGATGDGTYRLDYKMGDEGWDFSTGEYMPLFVTYLAESPTGT